MPESEFTTRYQELAPALHVWASLRLRPQLRAHCEVGDLLQEVWCRAFAIRDRFDPEATTFRPWLFRVAKNVLLEAVREAQRVARFQAAGGSTRLFDLERVAAEVTTITRRVARDDAIKTFRERVDSLPDDERDLVVHIGLEGMTYRDAATRLGLEYETVKKRWLRLRTRMETNGVPAALLETIAD